MKLLFRQYEKIFPRLPTAVVLSLLLPAVLLLPCLPLASKLLAPIDLFAASAHKLSHVTISTLTSGYLYGLLGFLNKPSAVVSDSIWCLYLQAGYLAAAACLTIGLAFRPRLSRIALLLIGVAFGLATVIFTITAALNDRLLLGGLSVICGLTFAAGFAFVSLRMPRYASLLLFCIGVQGAVLAFDAIRWLILPINNSYIVAAAHANFGQRLWSRHAGLVHMGYLACAVSVSHVLRDAGVSTVDELSVKGLENQLLTEGWQRVPFGMRQAGDVIIALGPKDQHTGVVGETRDITFDNHSSNGRWLQDPASYWTTELSGTDLHVLRAPPSLQQASRTGATTQNCK